MANDPDPDLLQSGAENFGAFYERHESAVLAFFLRRTGSADLAADLTAETFARALEGRRNFDPARGDACGWLFGIGRHLLADSLRAGVVEDAVRRRLGMPIAALDDDALARILSLADQPALAALAMLPADQRDAVQGRIIDGRDYPTLAIDLRCSQSVARKRVSRALCALRDRMETT